MARPSARIGKRPIAESKASAGPKLAQPRGDSVRQELADEGSSPAVEAIRAALRRVPVGYVVTYGQLAAIAGFSGRARLVGRSLGQRAGEAALPWYRVLAAPGRIAFPAGSAAFEEQRRWLEAEGVAVVAGRVDLKRYQWRPGSAAPVLD
jgi:methylated-DNA-protein-cysteine methyltransferase-like protein